FDAMTGAINNIEIRGRDRRALAETWVDGPVNYLGLSVHGFPNLFMVTGPGSPSVLTNMIVSIQHHVEWITDCLARLRDSGLTTIEANVEAQREWVEHVNRVFMPLPGFPAYAQRCAEVARDNYKGFITR
ncbi:MAG: cyclohexanone monooxygenase, partial [Acidimicrobiia bacterium]|nr:cyclohexanone monooxygenase [Acidimicrobiia bacterium]